MRFPELHLALAGGVLLGVACARRLRVRYGDRTHVHDDITA